MKIAGVTWHGVDNFGSMLQAYALQRTIEKAGVKHTYISYAEKVDLKYALYYYYRYLRSMVPWLNQKKDLFSRFHRMNIKATLKLFSRDNIHAIGDKYDGYICGSDQVWAPNVLDTTYMLDFVREGRKKIAYAASIGLNDIPQELTSTYEKNLKDFLRISVREKTGQDLLIEKCRIQSQVVLDPTMLLSADEWKKVEKPISIESKYAFCYFLSESNDYLSRKEITNTIKGMPFIGVTAQNNTNQIMRNITDRVGPAQFLWLVDHAECVITDSFHGAVFSILFKKKFILCSRFDSNDPVCQNSRIEQLCRTMKMDKYKRDGIVFFEDLNHYVVVEDIVSDKRKESIRFLLDAISRIGGAMRKNE